MDATGQAGLVSSGQVTPAELLDAAIERIIDLDPGVNAVVMRWFDAARATVAGPVPGGVFGGVPFLLKDLLVAYAGQPLSDGNRRLKEAAVPSPADATVVARFRAADRGLWRGAGVLRAVNIGAMVARLAESLGRPVTAADVEPVNWALAEQAREVSAVDYVRALESRTLLRRTVQQWWADGFDLLLTPTLGEPPAPIGAFAGDTADLPALAARSGRCVAFTLPFNISGQPAISLPLHWSADGLPIGVQLVAAYGREDVLMRVVHQLEQARPWASRHPETPE